MLDLLSVVIGGVCVGVPFAFFVVWVSAKAYELGWNDCERGKWIGDEEEASR